MSTVEKLRSVAENRLVKRREDDRSSYFRFRSLCRTGGTHSSGFYRNGPSSFSRDSLRCLPGSHGTVWSCSAVSCRRATVG